VELFRNSTLFKVVTCKESGLLLTVKAGHAQTIAANTSPSHHSSHTFFNASGTLKICLNLSQLEAWFIDPFVDNFSLATDIDAPTLALNRICHSLPHLMNRLSRQTKARPS
jgi:hypothetical protein